MPKISNYYLLKEIIFVYLNFDWREDDLTSIFVLLTKMIKGNEVIYKLVCFLDMINMFLPILLLGLSLSQLCVEWF